MTLLLRIKEYLITLKKWLFNHKIEFGFVFEYLIMFETDIIYGLIICIFFCYAIHSSFLHNLNEI